MKKKVVRDAEHESQTDATDLPLGSDVSDVGALIVLSGAILAWDRWKKNHEMKSLAKLV